jgi:hypothetical protein
MSTPFASCLLVLAACSSSSPLDPGSGNSTGTGTGTLLLAGTASARATITNTSNPTDFTTDFAIHVSLADQAVTTGTVTITSTSGKTALVFTGADATGTWQGTAPDYDEVYQLDVASGSDVISGVRVDGPDIHTFSSPTAGASVDATQAMTVTWNRSDTADAATLRVGDGGASDLAITDSGSYSVAPGSLKTNKQQAETNMLRLTRSNQVVPTGAVAGSQLTVSIENDLDVVALPDPAGN